VNNGWDLPLPPADFGNLRVSDHSAIWQRRKELGCSFRFLYPPPVGPPVFLAVTVADGAVVALIKGRAIELNLSMGIGFNFKGSDDCLTGFKKRYGIRQVR